MNKEQIIDEAYENYRKKEFERIMSQNHGEYLMGKEEFINKCKTDTEFSEMWGLKIEERELSHKERSDLKNSSPYNYGKPANGKLINERLLNSNNVPTKLITVTYEDTIIESYEQSR